MYWLRAFRRWRTGPPQGVVLLYHRIAAGQVDPYSLCVSPEHFDQHMAVVAQRFTPLALNEFVNRLANRTLPPRAIAVTFDDGYVDNFETAGPILERHGIDATVYMVTGPGGREQELWWDELERIFLSPRYLPAQLAFEANGRRYTWDLGEAAEYTQEQAAQYVDWRVPWNDIPDDQADVPTPRHKAFREVYFVMQPMSPTEQDAMLAMLRDWAGIDKQVRPTHRTLPLDQLAQTVRGSRISIGAHTIDHPALAKMSLSEQQRQLATSRDVLAACLSSPITTATYPYGLYSRKTLRAANQCGFDAAFICGDSPVSYGINPVEIPRIQLPDIDGEQFESLLNKADSIPKRNTG